MGIIHIEEDGFGGVLHRDYVVVAGEDNVLFIPKNREEIRPEQYKEYKELQMAIIPNHITKIGCAAFKGCENLHTIIIPGSVKEISDFAFTGCGKLWDVQIEEGLKKLGNFVFQGTSVTSVVLPNSVEEISRDAFLRSSVDTVYLSEKMAEKYVKSTDDRNKFIDFCAYNENGDLVRFKNSGAIYKDVISINEEEKMKKIKRYNYNREKEDWEFVKESVKAIKEKKYNKPDKGLEK